MKTGHRNPKNRKSCVPISSMKKQTEFLNQFMAVASRSIDSSIILERALSSNS